MMCQQRPPGTSPGWSSRSSPPPSVGSHRCRRAGRSCSCSRGTRSVGARVRPVRRRPMCTIPLIAELRHRGRLRGPARVRSVGHAPALDAHGGPAPPGGRAAGRAGQQQRAVPRLRLPVRVVRQRGGRASGTAANNARLAPACHGGLAGPSAPCSWSVSQEACSAHFSLASSSGRPSSCSWAGAAPTASSRRWCTPPLPRSQTFLGYEQGRPSAPFSFTNEWGLHLALTLPFFVVGWFYRASLRRRLFGSGVLALLPVVPVVASLNRGLWLALIVCGVALASGRPFWAGRSPWVGSSLPSRWPRSSSWPRRWATWSASAWTTATATTGA